MQKETEWFQSCMLILMQMAHSSIAALTFKWLFQSVFRILAPTFVQDLYVFGLNARLLILIYNLLNIPQFSMIQYMKERSKIKSYNTSHPHYLYQLDIINTISLFPMQTTYYNESTMFNHYPFEQNHDHINYDQLSLDATSATYNMVPYQTFNEQAEMNDHMNQNYFIAPQYNPVNQPSFDPVALQNFFYDDSASRALPSGSIPPSYQQPNVHHDGLISFQVMAKSNEYRQYDSFPVISTDYSSESSSTTQSSQFSSASSANTFTYESADLPEQYHYNQINHYSIPSPTATSNVSSINTPLASPISNSNSHQSMGQRCQLASPTSPKKLSSRHSASSRRASFASNKITKSYKRSSSSSTSPHSSTKSLAIQHTTQPGPIPASKPQLSVDPLTGGELLSFSHSKQKIIKNFTIKCPPMKSAETIAKLPQQFLLDNCVYPRAMCSSDEYKGNRYQYEKECNEIGWNLSWLNPEIRDHRGLIQRAVDSWRNTRPDKKLRSRRVRKHELVVN